MRFLAPRPKLKEMKELSRLSMLFLLGLSAAGAQAAPASVPTVAGPLVELRRGPLFDAPTQGLARTWGPALAPGTPFRVERVYGRWLYGTPQPPDRMLEKDFAKPGWVFSRALLLPGDQDTLPPALVQEGRGVLYHGRLAWRALGVGKEPLRSPLDFFESLTLSKRTLEAFARQDETPLGWALPPPLPFWPMPSAFAAGEEADPSKEAPMGLSGTDLGFLDQEFQVLQTEKEKARRAQAARKLHPPQSPPLGEKTRTAILGRFMMQKYLELPPLTHEEVDGYIYMRATARRALDGCPAPVRAYWAKRRWNHFRVYRLKSRSEQRQPWLEVVMPGGYVGISAKAIELAGNEAEMAFLLVRPLVKELRVKRKGTAPSIKGWPASLESLSEEAWSRSIKSHSTRDSENLDVADEIAVDMQALECISRAGYRPMAGLSYLRKLAASRSEPWASWFNEHYIGTDYRIDRVATLLNEALAKRSFPAGTASNPKRFSTAARHWNLLP